MPQRWLRAHVAEIRGIEARESLIESTRLAMAMGRMKKADAEKLAAEWRRDAGIVTAVRPKTRKEMIDALRGMGAG